MTVTPLGSVVITLAGKYRVKYQLNFASAPTSGTTFWVAQNGTSIASTKRAPSGSVTTVASEAVVDLTPGDTLAVMIDGFLGSVSLENGGASTFIVERVAD